MKKSLKYKGIILAVLISSAVFLFSAFLTFTTGSIKGADVPKSDEPYENNRIPPNTYLLLNFDDGYSAAVKLDFEEDFVSVLLLPPSLKNRESAYGYTCTEILNADYGFITRFIDTLGGIEADLDGGGEYLCAGVTVTDRLASDTGNTELKKAVITAVIKNISKYGFSTDSLLCIMNGETSLSYPDCYGWCEYGKKVCTGYNVTEVTT